MEEHNVSFLHQQIDLLSSEFLIFLDAKVSLIDLSIFRVGVVIESALVGLGENMQATVFSSAVFECCPGGHNIVGGAEREIGQVLMERMPGALTHVRRFVNKHGMDGLDVVSTEAFEVRDQIWIGAIALEDVVKLEILHFCDVLFSYKVLIVGIFFSKADVPYNLHAGQPESKQNYGSRVLLQYYLNLTVHLSMSSCLRKFLTTMKPFSS